MSRLKPFLKNKPFMIGCIFLMILLILSFMYPVAIKGYVPKPPSMLYIHGKLVDKAPYPPSLKYPLGVDRFAEDVLWEVVDGAKYTILIAVLVGLCRVVIGLAGGIVYGSLYRRIKWLVEPLVRAFRFIPAVLICLMFFPQIMNESGSGGLVSDLPVIWRQLEVIIFVAVIPLTGVVGEEVMHYLKNDFVTASRLLGASRWHIIRNHVIPYLKPKLFLLFLQQISLSLLLLVQIGAFNRIIGVARMVRTGGSFEPQRDVTLSMSNEWSGLIGLTYRELMLDKWIVLGPSIGFILSLLALNLMVKGAEKVLSEQVSGTSVHSETVRKRDKKTNLFDFVNVS